MAPPRWVEWLQYVRFGWHAPLPCFRKSLPLKETFAKLLSVALLA